MNKWSQGGGGLGGNQLSFRHLKSWVLHEMFSGIACLQGCEQSLVAESQELTVSHWQYVPGLGPPTLGDPQPSQTAIHAAKSVTTPALCMELFP
jgi:hypothetical protein